MEPSAIVIDSWENLAKRKDVSIMAGDNVLTEAEMNNSTIVKKFVDNYFPRDSVYYEALTKKLSLFPINRILSDDYRDQLYENASKGIAALMSQKQYTDYFVHHLKNGKYRNKLHVSTYGGNIQPMFISSIGPPTNHTILIKFV